MDPGNEEIRFSVPGPPKGKARARTFYNSRLGRMQSVTPEGTVLYENLIKACFMETAGRQRIGDEVPVCVRIRAYFEPPRSTSARKRKDMLSGTIRPAKKPDLDNIVKSVLDALNGLAYRDDTQVMEIYARKDYGDTPRVEISLARSEER